jgi:uncharacterized protein YdhG (YjbR/CyaY superfamily)
MKKQLFENIDQYIAAFPIDTQKLLQQMRQLILKAAPNANECIKYAIPTFEYFGNLVHFAAYKNHVGFYPSPSGLIAFQKEIDTFTNSKGAVQFPLNKPLPKALISKIVKFRVIENENRFKLKRIKKTCKQGHVFYKSSKCPACPICCNENKATIGFMKELSIPVQRALIGKKITSLQILSAYTEKEILLLHGIGKSSIPQLKSALANQKLNFKSD